MPIEHAIYTDVTADEAINHRDGFQFQATSEGFTAEDEAKVVGDGLFSPAFAWLGAHGDETTHPQQATFTCQEGRYYISRARALGRTLSGRPGNQLTAFAVAPTADDLAPYTPAQLLAADDWSLEKAATSRPAPWITPVSIDERFEDEALEEMARADARIAEALPLFLGMLRRSVLEPGHRVVMEHADLDVVLRWLALGTMLLDPETAQQVTFRAFLADPWRGDFRVVGVHPELQRLEPSSSWKDVPTASWIDLDTLSVGNATAGSLDLAVVRWLLEHGSFDARNAVQIEHRLAPVLGDELAMRTAELLAVGDVQSPLAVEIATDAVIALARGGDVDALELYEDELLDPLTMIRGRSEADFCRAADVIRALLDAGMPDLAAAVAGPALEALAGAPDHASVFSRRVGLAASPLVWADADAAAAASDAWARALAGAPSMDLAALFAATGRLGLSLSPRLLERAVDRLAALWASDPSVGVGRDAWCARGAVEAQVAERVAADLDRGDAQQIERLADGAWDSLLSATATRLAPWAYVRELTRLPAEHRARELAKADGRRIPQASRPLVVGRLTLPFDAELVSGFIRKAGVDDVLAAELASLLGEQRRAPVAVGMPAGTRWAVVFDALLDARREGADVGVELSAALDAVSGGRELRRGAAAGTGELDALYRVGAVEAEIWAIDDPVGTGRALVAVRDHRAAAHLAEMLGAEAATAAIDSHLAVEAELGRAVEAGREVVLAHGESLEPLRSRLGAAAARFLRDHREVERTSKNDEELIERIQQIRAEHPSGDRGLFGRARGWMRGNR